MIKTTCLGMFAHIKKGSAMPFRLNMSTQLHAPSGQRSEGQEEVQEERLGEGKVQGILSPWREAIQGQAAQAVEWSWCP